MLSITSVFAEENPIVVNPGYKAGDYSFTGTSKVESGSSITTRKFSGKATPESFQFSCELVMGMTNMRGELKVDKQGGSFKVEGMAEKKFSDPSMAVASATGVSGGTAELMYSLWAGKQSAFLPSQNLQVVQSDHKTEVSGNTKNIANHAVVTLNDGLLVSLKTVFDPSLQKEPAAKPEVNDQQIKDVLKSMGRQDSQEEIDKVRKMMQKSIKSAAGIHDKMTTMTLITVTGLPK